MYPKDNKKHIYSRSNGFTLIELMVVISIIAMLMAMLMPALSKTKEIARQVVCMANQKGLWLAWEMYAQENNDGLCHPETKANNDPGEHYWVSDGLAGVGAGNTFASLKDGALWPYTEAEGLYKCPSDKTGLIRSYSISFLVGQTRRKNDQPPFQSKGDIKRPSSTMVFIDAMPWFGQPWLTEPFWPINFETLTSGLRPMWKFEPTITARHSNGCIAFMAGGNAEKVKWENQITLDIANREVDPILPLYSTNNDDIDLLEKILLGTH